MCVLTMQIPDFSLSGMVTFVSKEMLATADVACRSAAL